MATKAKAVAVPAVAAPAVPSYERALDYGYAAVKSVDPMGFNRVGGFIDGGKEYFSAPNRAVINANKAASLQRFRNKIGIL